MSTQDNEPRAFPVNELNQYSGQVAVQHLGMSLRDYFAAKAMQATIIALTPTGALEEAAAAYVVAKGAYFMADAMLKERQS